MPENNPKPTGGRRAARPKTVEICPQCGDALGGGYYSCSNCHEAIERYWLADWQALREQEGVCAGFNEEKILAQKALTVTENHAWTVVDFAMSLKQCSECGCELGEGYPQCGECGMALGASILSEFDATPNEHALHIGRWVLRFPHRNSENINAAWRLSVPRMLTGWLPSTQDAQHMMDRIKAGELDEVKREIKQLDWLINQSGLRDEKGSEHERSHTE